MTGKMSKTARQATRAGQRGRADDIAASSLVAISDGHERLNADGTPKGRCGSRLVNGWRYGTAADVACGFCRAERTDA